MKKQRLLQFTGTILMSVMFTIMVKTPALAAEITWSGGGADSNISTASNWVGGTVPTNGDSVVFPSNLTNRTATNDIPSLSLTGITFSGAVTSSSDYTINGTETIILAGDITNTTFSNVFSTYKQIVTPLILSGNRSIIGSAVSELSITGSISLGSNNLTVSNVIGSSTSLSGNISGTGTINKSGSGLMSMFGVNTSFSGNIVVENGSINSFGGDSLGNSTGTTTIDDGADITFNGCSAISFSEPLFLNGASSQATGSNIKPKLAVSVGCTGGGGAVAASELFGDSPIINQARTAALTGPVTLGSDVTFAGRGQNCASLTISGSLSGAHKINMLDGFNCALIVSSSANTSQTENGIYNAKASTTTLSDYLPLSNVLIQKNSVLTITGTRRDVTITEGTLKGSGTVGQIFMSSGSVLAPGLSPGILNAGNTTFTGGTYEAEIGGTALSEFDQLNVTGTVDLGSATSLVASLWNDYKPALNSKFVIIKNDAYDAVTGTFTGMAEGATFTISGYTFEISYVGGDGNDVELTTKVVPTVSATSAPQSQATAPKAPDTGFSLKTTSVVFPAIITAGAFGVLLMQIRRFSFAKRR